VGEHPVEWPRDVLEFECVDEEAGVADLAASAAAHEPSKLLLGWSAPPRRHPLECSEAVEIAFLDRDRLEASRLLADRGWGKAADFEPLEGDPLGVGDVEAAAEEFRARILRLAPDGD
jgi:hypothetical protein